MWLLVWITFTMDTYIKQHSFDLFDDYNECTMAMWEAKKSKSLDPSLEAISCIEIVKDK